jgi:hypothetical protein
MPFTSRLATRVVATGVAGAVDVVGAAGVAPVGIAGSVVTGELVGVVAAGAGGSGFSVGSTKIFPARVRGKRSYPLIDWSPDDASAGEKAPMAVVALPAPAPAAGAAVAGAWAVALGACSAAV